MSIRGKMWAISLCGVCCWVGDFQSMYRSVNQRKQKKTVRKAFEVTFDVSMLARKAKEKGKKQKIKQKSEDWRLYDSLYTQHVLKHRKFSTQPRIPRIIHQIWLGSPFPEKYRGYQHSWLKLHPGWEYKLWTDKEVEEFGLKNKALYDKARNYGEKSDIARYEILYRHGGLYIDTDFEALKSFDVFHHMCDFYMGLVGNGVPQNGLIGSVAGHPIMRECIDSLTISTQGGAGATLGATGPFHLMRCFKKHAHEGICIAFPTGYFYAWPPTERRNNSPKLVRKWLQPESYAIHYWEVSWNGGVFRR